MVDSKTPFLLLNLQLFAEGGTSAGGESGDTATAAGSQNSVTEQNATAQAPQIETPDRNAEFEKLIKGEYKDLYDARVQDTIQRRLKGTKETVDRYNALTPTIEMLSRKYGVDAGDIESLNKAIEDDDSYYEDEALEKGVTVQQLKEIRKMERENAQLKAQMREQSMRENADRIYAKWMSESEALKSVYPNFNLEAEMQNPQFLSLLKNNIDVRTAYEVSHKDEIIGGAMQFAAKSVEQKLSNKIMSGGSRPTENGITSQSSVLTSSDVSQLSKTQREDLIRRAQRGERITFGK